MTNCATFFSLTSSLRPLARAATLQAHCHAAPRRDSGSADESRSNSSALSRKISPIVVGAGLFAGAGAGAAYFSSQRAKSLSGSFEDDSVGYEQPVTEPKAMGGEGFSMSSTSVSSSPEYVNLNRCPRQRTPHARSHIKRQRSRPLSLQTKRSVALPSTRTFLHLTFCTGRGRRPRTATPQGRGAPRGPVRGSSVWSPVSSCTRTRTRWPREVRTRTL